MNTDSQASPVLSTQAAANTPPCPLFSILDSGVRKAGLIFPFSSWHIVILGPRRTLSCFDSFLIPSHPRGWWAGKNLLRFTPNTYLGGWWRELCEPGHVKCQVHSNWAGSLAQGPLKLGQSTFPFGTPEHGWCFSKSFIGDLNDRT